MKLLDRAEDEARKLGDEYVSTEHLLLGAAAERGAAGEALRGAGATLVDEQGRRVLADAGPGAELLPRDVVARALWSALGSGLRTFLDARAAVGESFPERFPTVFEACRLHGLDPRREPIPVAPAAHYHMGGVDVDLDGCTSVAGLWAAGEVACTGVHGANRLASNSLLEALVFGARVARSVSLALPHLARPTVTPDLPVRPMSDDDGAAEAQIRRLMWEKAGLVRSGEGLREALSWLESLAACLAPGTEASNLGYSLSIARQANLERPSDGDTSSKGGVSIGQAPILTPKAGSHTVKVRKRKLLPPYLKGLNHGSA